MRRILRRRIRVLGAGLALAALVAPSAAVAGVSLRGVDASRYPTVRFSVVTQKPSTAAPAVTENGRPVAGLQTFNLAAAKSVAVLLDRSQSMKGKPIKDAAAAAGAFIDSKPARDKVEIVGFGRTAVALSGFSPARIDSQSVLDTLSVDRHQGTALYDAIVLAAEQLGSEDNAGRVIIVLTDGADVSSEATLNDAVEAARKVGAAIYPIGIEGRSFSPSPLQQLARATGGTYHRAVSTATLPAVYAAIAHELARTWRIEYLTAARPGDALKLSARVPDSGKGFATLTVPGSAEVPQGGLLPSVLTSSVGSTLALVLLVALLVLAGAFTATAGREGMWLRNRLDVHVTEPAAVRKRRSGDGGRFGAFRALAQGTDEAFAHLKQWKSIRRLLERADLPLRPAEFVYLCAACGIGLGLLVALSGIGPLMIVIAMAFGASAPFGYVKFRASRRLKAFENQLPDLLVTVAASLKAGHSFRQGLQTVVEEGQPPAASEFKRVLTETRLGRPMDDALTEMGERVGSKNLDFVITAVTIQRQVGGSLAGLFDMVADAVRQRQQFQRKIKSLTATGRMSAYVLLGLPIFMALSLTVMNPKYMAPLYHTPTGHKLVYVSIAMMAMGSAVLKKIVSFKG